MDCRAESLCQQFLRDKSWAEQETHNFETDVKSRESRAVEAAERTERSDAQEGIGGSLAETYG